MRAQMPESRQNKNQELELKIRTRLPGVRVGPGLEKGKGNRESTGICIELLLLLGLRTGLLASSANQVGLSVGQLSCAH